MTESFLENAVCQTTMGKERIAIAIIFTLAVCYTFGDEPDCVTIAMLLDIVHFTRWPGDVSGLPKRVV